MVWQRVPVASSTGGVSINVFRCPVRDRMTASKWALDRHLKTHSADKPYVCHICSKTFKYKDSWSNHTKMHSMNESL
ncbi:hypothetical protein DPMN_091398 [Dreissena polymorpha]|uniref:C2H2-type domain-containing protein n=1 Tax=Dreissena polymorpha TaxID=45954 RepID=A0A9D4QZX8_DREPO|nr:hypothetical protein DPMN_091398 [Dreissena polymorpha]